jgi:hypothetical protein
MVRKKGGLEAGEAGTFSSPNGFLAVENLKRRP